MKKFGIIGTACAGKTTLCYEILAELKKSGIKCDGLVQTDCDLGFDRSLLDTDRLAQWALITKQISLEAKMAMRTDIDVMICDRSPLDLYAYYKHIFGDTAAFRRLVEHWCATTYTMLYFVPPLPYQASTARCSEDFRDVMHYVMREFFRSYKGNITWSQHFLEGSYNSVLQDIKVRSGVR